MAHAVLMDDNRDNLGVLANLLELEGISATIVDLSRKIDIEATLNQLPAADLIFLDLEMPVIDGYQMLDLLKAHPRLKLVPVVAYTVHTGEMNHARQLGFHSFLAKPLDVDRFPAQLQRILKGEHVWAGV